MKIAKTLFKRGANTETQNDNKFIIFHHATVMNYEKTTLFLFQYETNIQVETTHINTSLYLTVVENYSIIIQHLFENNVEINI